MEDEELQVTIRSLADVAKRIGEKYIIEGIKVYRYTNVTLLDKTGTVVSIGEDYNGNILFNLTFLDYHSKRGEAEAIVELVRDYKERRNPTGLMEQIDQSNTIAYKSFTIEDIEEVIDELTKRII